MSKDHPGTTTLLLFLEGELDRETGVLVHRHISDCWSCQAECERIRQGIYTFVDYRERVLLPSIPTKPQTCNDFRRRLHEIAAARQGQVSQGLFRFLVKPGDSLRRSRSNWLGRAVAAAILVLVVVLPIPMTQPPTMSAATFIENARAAAGKSNRHSIQRIRIRYGGQAAEHKRRLGVTQEMSNEPLPPEIVRALDLAGIDPKNPLDAESFARWHGAQKQVEDVVRESADAVGLETVTPRNARVKSASLTVSRSDWRAISRRAQLRDLPAIEVTEIELAFESLPAVKSAPTTVADETREMPPASIPGPSSAELERAEAQLRHALHQLRADVEESPEVIPERDGVRLKLYVGSIVRRDEILTAIRTIPLVTPDVYELETAADPIMLRKKIESNTDELYQTTPPLAEQLAEMQGGPEQARQYLTQVQAAFEPLIREALALRRLAERYPELVYQRLPEESREMVDAIARDHVESIATLSGPYLALVGPTLQYFHPIGDDSNATNTATCQTWRDAGQALAPELLDLRRSWVFLFSIQALPKPEALDPNELLVGATRARGGASATISGMCRLKI